MQDQVDQLVKQLFGKLETLEPTKRLLVGVSGIPGSGKSSLATRLVSALNALSPSSSSDIAIYVGMDGWHYPRSVLSTLPNPQEAFDRRGSEWTFDSKRFADFVVKVKNNATSPKLTAPSFDHAQKDPLEDDVAVLPSHRVVVFEGLYCNCDVGEWKRAATEFDARLVFEIEKEEAKKRLVARHVKTGVARDEAEATWRADNNDLPNGDWLISHLLKPYTLVKSIDDPSWR
ncbi:related to YFH7 - putative kinase [Ustilago trichophora]|uniref:Related to YFH7 - putative kinase n=1 Tax=Ustilago trichophora TaxID=86804 RepID=A0A5C3DZ86_9BASI|nr:related to YFH7 - putative kinase [Ustilago trichophora]